MYDEVECAADLPDEFLIAGLSFQTKSLYRSLDRFSITKEGRLVLHACRYEHTGQDGWIPLMTRIPTEDVDLDFHGDIRLMTSEGEIREYAVRFTHGRLEWVRPFADLSEAEQMLVTRRNLED